MFQNQQTLCVFCGVGCAASRGTATRSDFAMQSDKIRQHLNNVNFPVDKNELTSKLRNNGAPDDVIRQVQQLPQDRFQSEQDITRALQG